MLIELPFFNLHITIHRLLKSNHATSQIRELDLQSVEKQIHYLTVLAYIV